MGQTSPVAVAARDTLKIDLVVLGQYRPRPFGGSRRSHVQSGQFGKRIENEFDKLALLHNPVLS